MMDNRSFLLLGRSDALTYTQQALIRFGCKVLSSPGPAVKNLILPVPSFEVNGSLKGGSRLEFHLNALPRDVTVYGGNLNVPLLEGYRKIDLLQDKFYLAQNAAITAHCAVKQILNALPVTLDRCPVLILGWGRIGKCLAQLLRQMGAEVTVYARKETDCSILEALGYRAVDILSAPPLLQQYRVICNTAPTMLLTREHLRFCNPNCLKLDLASEKGIEGDDVLWARGLPGKDAPETSGLLIAETVLRLAQRKE